MSRNFFLISPRMELSGDACYPGKREQDLNLATTKNYIDGVPKISPGSKNILLFRACMDESGGITITDTAGTYRAWIANGFGPVGILFRNHNHLFNVNAIALNTWGKIDRF